eukprot:jgi/Undpi1/10483/HiC_scaffold_29.g12933.m1
MRFHCTLIGCCVSLGYYAGALSSAFMVGRLFASHFWGLVSDRYGNRFVLVVGIVSNAVLSVAFGFSTTLTWAFTSRFLLGLFNGMMAASKTLVPHVCGKEHETARVIAQWRHKTINQTTTGVIEHENVLKREIAAVGMATARNPYLLPNVAAAGLTLLALPLVLIFIDEPRKSGNDGPTDEEQPKDHITAVVADAHETKVAGPKLSMVQHVLSKIQKISSTQTEKTPMIATTFGSSQGVAEPLSCNSVDVQPTSLLAQPHIRTLLFIDMLFSLSYAGFDEVFSLWCLSTVEKGGLDWSTVQIGQFYVGISVAVNNATGPERRGELNGIEAAVTAFTRALSPVMCSVEVGGGAMP